MMKIILKRTLLFPLFVLFLMTALAQSTTTITGRVFSDEKQTPLEGAAITVKGQGSGTVTGKNGEFSVNSKIKNPIIVITYAGFEKQEIKWTEGQSINITLKADKRQLEDVVVTGYSSQNKKFIAGSIYTVKGDDIKDIPAAGFNQLLQGKATGVQVTSNSGVPGGGVTFRIRGNNSINASVDPLYIIDGVFISNSDPVQTSMGNQQQSNPIADINPSDIENITILIFYQSIFSPSFA